MPMTIRSAQPEDIEQIVEFNCRLAKETEDKDLDPEVVTAVPSAPPGPAVRFWELFMFCSFLTRALVATLIGISITVILFPSMAGGRSTFPTSATF